MEILKGREGASRVNCEFSFAVKSLLIIERESPSQHRPNIANFELKYLFIRINLSLTEDVSLDCVNIFHVFFSPKCLPKAFN